jgi:hypothetical protein
MDVEIRRQQAHTAALESARFAAGEIPMTPGMVLTGVPAVWKSVVPVVWIGVPWMFFNPLGLAVGAAAWRDAP